MAKATKQKHTTELIAGICTIGLALALLYGLVLCLGRFHNYLQQLSSGTRPSTAPGTTLAPTPPGSTLPKNPYGAGDFVYKNGYLTCLAGESLLGVDVSEYQGSIDWPTVAAQNVRFAMVRVGARGWGQSGAILIDHRWEENLDGAQAAGLMTGVYFFSQAISVEEAREEARFVLNLLDGRPLALPVVFDWEIAPSETARTADMTPDMLNHCAVAFCEEIRKAGYTPMVYFNQELGYHMLDLSLLHQQEYPFWLAMYTSALTFPHRVAMWQYTSGGTVAGITGPVDLNLYFLYDEKQTP